MKNLESFLDNFQDPWYIGLVAFAGTAIIVIVILSFVIAHYRKRHLKTSNITIFLDGGQYQGSDGDLVFHVRPGTDFDLTRIVPEKKGYSFSGFNAYKRYVSSVIDEDGLRKEVMTSEELDGMGKDVLTVPPYDLYLVAKYAPLNSLMPQGLSEEEYYNDFLTYEDLVSDIKHMNYDKKNFPVEIKLKHDEKIPGVLFLFKGEALMGALYPYHGITKVYFRTGDNVKNKLLTPFYQEEDVNDAMNWYSFIVTYTTKPQRFTRSFISCYKEIDETMETSETEFNLIVGSLPQTFNSPVLDRALALTEQYEKDRNLPVVPRYVKERMLPSTYESDSEALSDVKKEAEEDIKAETEEKKIEEKEIKEEKTETSAETEKEETEPEEKASEEQVPLAEPEKEAKPRSFDEFSDEDIEKAHADGHFIQPKRDARFLKWEKATREEKLNSIKKYYEYHPELKL